MKAKAVLVFWSALLPLVSSAQTTEVENWSVKGQTTYVYQHKPSFPALYSGPNSLRTETERSYSFTTTGFFGARPWRGGELYFDPEISQGVPLSGLTGLGGFTNGEIARTAGPHPVVYRARLFLRQTWGFGGGSDVVESDANQLAGSVDKRRIVMTAGNLSVPDLFDDNAYSHDPRTQFLNWALITHGAFDFAADARGYSWGVALEYVDDDWAIRAGRFLQPKEPNQLRLDTRFFRHYGDQVELEHAHVIGDQPGKLRVLGFRNVARMSRYEDAIELAGQTGGPPDINKVRAADQTKYGFGVNVEQALTRDLGLFSRASLADGHTETYAFTEIDRSVSGGLLLQGRAWARAQDSVGIAYVQNALSRPHRTYLALGGLGFFIGDGRLNYRPEKIVETFYNVGLWKHVALTFDYQHVAHPAYNADRGPASVGTMRVHAEF